MVVVSGISTLRRGLPSTKNILCPPSEQTRRWLYVSQWFPDTKSEDASISDFPATRTQDRKPLVFVSDLVCSTAFQHPEFPRQKRGLLRYLVFSKSNSSSLQGSLVSWREAETEQAAQRARAAAHPSPQGCGEEEGGALHVLQENGSLIH